MERTLAIHATTDLHGILLPEPQPDNGEPAAGGSLAQIASLLAIRRQRYPHNLYLDNGDILQGSPLVHYYGKHRTGEIHPVLAALTELRCQGLAIGNHEFDYGLDTLSQLASSSPVPFLSANILAGDTKEPFFGPPYRILDVHGIRIALLGVTTAMAGEGAEGVILADEVASVKRWLAELQEQQPADLLVVAYHGGTETDPFSGEPIPKQEENSGLALFEGIPEIDVLITGHQHRTFAYVEGNRALIQPGSYGSGLGEVRLAMQHDGTRGRWTVRGLEADVFDCTALRPDPVLTGILGPYQEMATTWSQGVVAVLDREYPLSDIVTEVFLAGHPLEQWMHDVIRKAAGTGISANAFANRKCRGFPRKEVTREDIVSLFPYPEHLWVLELSGEGLMLLLEESASMFAVDSSDPPQIGISPLWMKPHFRNYDHILWKGISYTLDLQNPPGKRLLGCQVDGRAVRGDDRLEIATSAFLAVKMETLLEPGDCRRIRRIDRELPDILLEDAERGGLRGLTVEDNREIRYPAGPDRR